MTPWTLLNRLQPYNAAHILLYHATYTRVPPSLASGIHNVPPHVIRRQLTWLKEHFLPVSVDALFTDPQPGQFAVTFDDGYESVFREALPVLLDLGIPSTIFLNCRSLEGKSFWRDKVRYLINTRKTEHFLEYYSHAQGTAHGMTPETFYRMSKQAGVNSQQMEDMIDRFFQAEGIDLSDHCHCIRNTMELVNHPLVTYGNHTFSHYLLSSLSTEEQLREIRQNQRALDHLGVRQTRIFSLPFGNTTDFTPSTVRLIAESGYQGAVLSRNRLNFPSRPRMNDGPVPLLERYMVPNTYEDFQRQLAGLWLRGLAGYPSSP